MLGRRNMRKIGCLLRGIAAGAAILIAGASILGFAVTLHRKGLIGLVDIVVLVFSADIVTTLLIPFGWFALIMLTMGFVPGWRTPDHIAPYQDSLSFIVRLYGRIVGAFREAWILIAVILYLLISLFFSTGASTIRSWL